MESLQCTQFIVMGSKSEAAIINDVFDFIAKGSQVANNDKKLRS